MTIVLVADSDAQYACRILAGQFEELGEPCLLVCSPKENSLQLPFSDARRAAELRLTPAELLSQPFLIEADALGVFFSGSQLETFVGNYRQLCHLQKRKPAPVFSGPIYPLVGDDLVADFISRLSCDILCLHGERQLAEYEELTMHWSIPHPKAVQLGFWFMEESPSTYVHFNSQQANAAKTLAVLVQKHQPSSAKEKARMIRLLINLARNSPEWHILIQRDYIAEAKSAWLSVKDGRPKSLPANLSFGVPENLPRLLETCTACITLSSPWVFAAMAWGRPSMVMGDYGFRTDHGSHLFFGSGVMTRLDTVEHLDQLMSPPPLNQIWLGSLGWDITDGPQQLLQILRQTK